MAEPKRFVRLEWGPQLIGPKHYRKGSVVEVSETRARTMVDLKVATFDPGPESEPPAEAEPAAGPEKRPKAK